MSQEILQDLDEKLNREKRFEKIKTSILTDYLAEKLKIEQKLAKYFNPILNVRYLNLRRKEKCIELVQNMDDFKNFAQKFIEYNRLIQKTYENLFKEHDFIEKIVFDNFIFITDKLICVFVESIDLLKKDYEAHLANIKTKFNSDKSTIEAKYDESIKDIDKYIFNLEANFYYETQAENSALIKKKDSINCEHMNQIMALRFSMENKIKSLEDSYKNMKAFIEREMVLLNKPNEIILKTKKIEKEIQKDKVKIKILNEKCRALQEEIELINIDYLLKDKREAIHGRYEEYRLCFQTFNEQEKNLRQKLTILVQNSTKAISKLKKQEEKVISILKMLKQCKKLEIIQEQNEPFVSKKNQTNEQFNHENSNNFESFLIEILNDINKCNRDRFFSILKEELENEKYNFYKKYSKVRVEIESLKLIRAKYLNENQILKSKLKSYISSLEVNLRT